MNTKRLLLISAILFTTILAWILPVEAQNRPPQNVYRVTVTSRYEIKDGKRTTNSRAIRQEIKDSLGRTHTILNRDYESQRVTSHTWHTFSGKIITRTDEFENERLIRFHLFTYTPDSLIASEAIYRVQPGDTSLYLNIRYGYTNRRPVQAIATSATGKKAYTLKSEWDSQGTEIKRTVKSKKGFAPLDSIALLTCHPTYDSLGRKVAETISRKFLDGSSKTQQFRYAYDSKGNRIMIEELNPSGSTNARTEMQYNDKGMLKFISRFDAQNNLIDYQAIRYELYPSRNRLNMIIEY